MRQPTHSRLAMDWSITSLVIVAFSAIPTLCLHAADRPNVIIVMTDDQGYGDLSCHGNPVLKTPNLDKLHGESVRFTNFHVDPTCSPTRGALMSGKFSHRARVWHTIAGGNHLRASELTMADAFRQSGYRTGLFGKWHLGGNYPYRPIDRGFDEWLGQGDGGTGTTDDWFDNDRVNDRYLHNGEWVKRPGWAPRVFFDAAAAFIRKNAAKDERFFAYVATYAPHSPHTIPDLGWLRKYERHGKKINAQVGGFFATIEGLDRLVGELRKALEETGQAENTVFIFMTDNGGTAGTGIHNAGMRGRKGSPYEGGHRVPFFVRWPGGRLAHGADVATLTAHIDVLPTLIELCDLKFAQQVDFDGRSFAEQLTKPDAKLPERILAVEVQRRLTAEKWKSATAMRGRWRLVNNTELYDLSKDPGQRTNVIGKHPAIAKQLRRDFDAYWKRVIPGHRDRPVPIAGTEHDRVLRLASMEWLERTPWNHAQVAKGPKVFGDWEIRLAKTGAYRFEVRRWPSEAQASIRGVPKLSKTVDAWDRGRAVRGLIYGGNFTALPIHAVRLQVGVKTETQEIGPNDTAAVFELQLPAGKVRVQATFVDAKGKELCGAYYVDVKRQ